MSKKLPRLPEEIQNFIVSDPELLNKLVLLSKYHYELSIDLQPEILLKLYEHVIERVFWISYERDRDQLLETMSREFTEYLSGEFDLDIFAEFFYWLIFNRVEIEEDSLTVEEFESLLEEFSETMNADFFHLQLEISLSSLELSFQDDYEDFITGEEYIELPRIVFTRAVENISDEMSVSEIVQRYLDMEYFSSDSYVHYFDILIKELIRTERTTVEELDIIFLEGFEDGMTLHDYLIQYEDEFDPEVEYEFYLSRTGDTFNLE